MIPVSHSFAARLRKLREERGMSKTGLGKAVGVSTTCVWNWEEGNTEPRPHNLAELARVLRVSGAYLEFGSDRNAPDDGAGCKVSAAPEESLSSVINDAKQRIAKLAGIGPERVKISLDY
ncbi:helix-turn-helix domain-containing protein [Limibaculum sp. M0105]|uniref:Helix-turn-helix domain-containing protein n=1 Tax=Thermohalobaculum xanthum TaxID=2753746 RepID=A0A8J7MAD9_9RHOB|nr:helix-turn-helix domain-containing protein [Thermohalobaculum xanthum]MBK0401215.1 helix-turn-helix domain-containing protein [Thermohalobaculum xanthum]